MIKRVFIIVLDSFGVGELPDAYKFSDVGSNTLKSISKSAKFKVDTLAKMGFGNIDGVDVVEREASPTAAVGRCAEASMGKDTTIGHWEIAGIISEKPLPTYPDGFPRTVIDEFSRLTGRGVLCNKPYSGTDVIRDFGREHLESGALIVYTSGDSVFQIAAHEDIVSNELLYGYCKIAREILMGENSVGRVIARPFIGSYPDFVRTPNRHDFSLDPPGRTMLDALVQKGFDTIGVGKINDIFAGKGIGRFTYTHSNKEGMATTMKIATEENFHGLCFVNLVDFDMLYGHRNNVDGYAGAISEFDLWLAEFIEILKDEDLLIITADHGCDPGTISTDHSREYTPLVVYSNKIKPVNLGTRSSFSDIAATVVDIFDAELQTNGVSFKEDIGL